MMLTGRQVLGALAALAAALAVFYPSGGDPHRLGEDLGADASGGCPLLRARRPRRGRPPSPRRSLGRLFPAAAVRVFVDATIWTGDATVPWAEAMAVTDAGRVLAVGRLGACLARRARARLESPSAAGGSSRVSTTRTSTSSPEGSGSRSSTCRASRRATRSSDSSPTASRDWTTTRVLGGGWDHTNWGGEEPTAEWFPGDVKAWLLRADAHVGVASRAALRAAGIDANTPDPPGGIVDRDADGNPTGTLRENAIALVSAAITPASEEARHAAFRRAFDHLLSLGVTSVCDFGDVDHLAGSSVEGATERLWRDLEHPSRSTPRGGFRFASAPTCPWRTGRASGTTRRETETISETLANEDTRATNETGATIDVDPTPITATRLAFASPAPRRFWTGASARGRR